MRQTTRLEVVAAANKWNVQEKGIGRLSSHPTKNAAADAAREIARQHTPCHVLIRNEDGTVEREDSYT